MMGKLVEMYRKGGLTPDHLIVECLHMIDPEDPALVLKSLPPEIIQRMLDFTRGYEADKMQSSYGRILPANDQVMAARRWIENISGTAARSKQLA